MNNMKKIFFIWLVIGIGFAGCKYDEDYIDAKLPKTLAYFASFQEYTRTVVVGEGMQFKIGAAMAGVVENTQEQTIDLKIGTKLNKTAATDTRILLPVSYYNSSELSGTIKTIIPKGEFIGYFKVKIDSVNFLNDPLTLNGKYTIPVNIVGTSLDSIAQGLDSIKVSVNYMAGVDGYYLYESVIKKEIGGNIVDSKTKTEKYPNESDNSAFRLLTKGPFKVEVTSAVAAFTTGLKFNMYVGASKVVTYESIAGQPVVTPENTNTYDSKTRDFTLNFNYKKTGNDTLYHVSSKLIFRNRIRDKLNETREYLSYFNK
jgi:hypothetical protein